MPSSETNVLGSPLNRELPLDIQHSRFSRREKDTPSSSEGNRLTLIPFSTIIALRRRFMKAIIGSVAILVLMGLPVYAQWKNVPPAKVPRSADGKPDLSAPAPRSPDGHPDLSGIWEPVGSFV